MKIEVKPKTEKEVYELDDGIFILIKSIDNLTETIERLRRTLIR